MATSTETPWDPGGFWDAIDQIRAYAAELYYLDKAVDYLEHDAPYPSANEVYGSTTTVPVRLGWTAPFTLTIRQPTSLATDGWIENINDRLQEFADAGGTWATSSLSSLGSRVIDLTAPSAAALTAAAERMVHDVQNTVVTTVPESLSASLQLTEGNFWGSTAESFYVDYVTPFGEARENQAFLAEGIAIVTAAGAAIVRQSQHSLMNAVCTTRDALKAQIELRQYQHSGAAEVATILMIAETANTLLGIFPLPSRAAGKSGAAGGADDETEDPGAYATNSLKQLLQTGLSYAASAVETPAEFTIAEKTAEGLQQGLDDAIGQIITRTVRHWDDLASERVDHLADAVAEMHAAKPLFPPRPDLADGATPRDFHYENSPFHT